MMHYKYEKNGFMLLLFISLVINVIMITSCGIACQKTDICKKLLAKIGLTDYNNAYTRHQIEYRCLEGWANCIKKYDNDRDVVFYGNSITYESDFHKLFPDIKICNLGCNRDDLDDMIHRSFIIKNVRPHKIFVLGGINSIINISLEKFGEKYNTLVDTIMNQNPTSQVYLQSLLPVNVEMDIGSRYVDLYSAYQVNDSMPKKYTRDGLHLCPEAYSIWARVISPYLLE